jgi:hypothetical protein
MNNNLEHKKTFKGYDEFTIDLEKLISSLDQKHYLERKVKFLLDIRGYIKTNSLQGNYVEFGSYRSEMQFAASRILGSLQGLKYFIGLDTFGGEPEKNIIDERLNLFDSDGDFSCNYSDVIRFVDEKIAKKGIIIKGDFRNHDTLLELKQHGPIAVSVVDCNLLSSVKAALEFTVENIIDGGLVYFDDYFYNINLMKELIKIIDIQKMDFISHNFYPPFAKSFVVIKK